MRIELTKFGSTRKAVGLEVWAGRKDIMKVRGAYVNPFKRIPKGVLPLTPLSLDIIRKALPNAIINKDVLAWYGEELLRREVQQSAFHDAIYEDRNETLYPFQRKGVSYVEASGLWYDRDVRMIIADDPRLGKTLQAIASVATLNNSPILVVTMKALIEYWAHAMDEWGAKFNGKGLTTIALTKGTIPQKLDILRAAVPGDVFVVNWEVLRKMQKFPARLFTTVIADETHIARNRKAQVTKGLLHLRPKNVILTTATPIERGPQDYWVYAKIIRPWEFKSYWMWVDWFCETVDGQFGLEIVGPANTDLLMDTLKPMMLRREIGQVGDVPEKIFKTIRVTPQPALMKMYNEIATKLFVEINDDYTLTVPNALARMTRLRQLSSCPPVLGLEMLSPKTGLVSALARRSAGNKMIVYTSFIDARTLIAAELNKEDISYIIYTGKEVQAQAFKKGNVQVLIVNPQVGGVGQDFSNASIIVYYDTPLSATLLRQSVQRTTKIGIKEPRLIINLVATPIEDAVAELVAKKLDVINDVDILTQILLAHEK